MTQASPAQHGMWMAANADAASTAYHMPLVITFDRALDAGALAAACSALVERHPMLASAIADRDGVAFVVPAPAPALRIGAAGDSVAGEISRPFDLATGPLARFALIDDTVLVITAHHLVFDGQSKDVLVRDLAGFYNGRVPAPLPVAFADLIGPEIDAEQLADRQTAAAEFWRDRWTEPLPLVVADRVLTSRSVGAGQVIEFPLAVPSVDGITRFEAILAGVHALLFRYGNSPVTTAVDLSTRTEPAAGLIGPMVNELPVNSTPRSGLAFDAFARSVRSTLRAIYPHRAVPLARAVPRIRPHAALAPISVSYRKREPAPEFAGVGTAVEWTVFNGAVRGDLQLQIIDSGETLAASLRYSAAAADVAPIFADDLRAILQRIADDPAFPLDGAGAAGSSTEEPQIDALIVAGAGDAELAAQVRGIWEEVLKIAPIADTDDLFDLGGHSLTITQIIARMRKNLNIDVSMDVFFDDPTINGVVDAVLSDR
jgi:acyl carrier protein